MLTLATILDVEAKRLKLTRYALAKASGMSAGRVQGILTGDVENPGILTVLKVLKALGRDLDWLARRLT